MSDMRIEVVPGASIVRLPSRIDVSNTRLFVDAVRGAISEEQPNVVLDFLETEAIDSTALGAVVQIYKQMRSSEGNLFLARVPDGVRRVFAITRLDRVFSIVDTVEDAIEALSKAS